VKLVKLGCRVKYSSKWKIRKIKLRFSIEDKVYTIDYNDLIYKCKRRLIFKLCYFNINYSLSHRQVVLGKPFIRKYYLILDYENNKVGLVRSKRANIIFR